MKTFQLIQLNRNMITKPKPQKMKFETIHGFSFNWEQYGTFHNFLLKLLYTPTEQWPDKTEWPTNPDMAAYTVEKHRLQFGKNFLIIKFDRKTFVPCGFFDYHTEKEYRFGPGSHTQSTIPEF